MNPDATIWNEPAAAASTLRVYLLGMVDFEAALRLQRALAFQVGSEPSTATLVLCEHAPLITVGRHGSPAHIHFENADLQTRRWPVRWVNRAGGCLLHLPGQLAIYPIIPLQQRGLGIGAYVNRLQQVLISVLDDFSVRGQTRTDHAGVWVGNRLIAEIGIAVCDWVAYHGMFFNINPDLPLFRHIQNGTSSDGPMTSLERERRGPLRTALVRERLLDHFQSAFGFDAPGMFFSHPLLPRPTAVAKGMARA
jgi:lipoyl(octanoyl) transferase